MSENSTSYIAIVGRGGSKKSGGKRKLADYCCFRWGDGSWGALDIIFPVADMGSGI